MSARSADQSNENVSRRSFLGLLGWIGIGLSAAVAAVGNFLFLKPAVNYGAPTNFPAGKPDGYKVGIKQAFEKERVVVVREKQGFAAISVICTHLGCTVRATDAGFNCPCHGSQFDNDGNVTGGPAPKPLNWYQVSLAPNGDLEIDKSVKVPQGTYFAV